MKRIVKFGLFLFFYLTTILWCSESTVNAPEEGDIVETSTILDVLIETKTKDDQKISDNEIKDTGEQFSGLCDDGNPCTKNDKLVNGKCVGEEYQCNDNLECTIDQCDGNGGCIFKIKEGFCLINGVCLKDKESLPDNPCILCDVSFSQTESAKNDGDECKDNDKCTVNEHCENGVCVFDTVDCDDQNPCTDDFCDQEKGCIHEFNQATCDDNNVCTLNDFCYEGECIHTEELNCDDGNPCTKDYCDPKKGCVFEKLSDVPCDDNNMCTTGDTCQNGVCVAGEVVNCDDGNSCTEDECIPQAGCVHTIIENNPCCASGQNFCDDNNVCTNDICDPVTLECSYEFNTDPCDDNNLCTENDVCNNGVCSGVPVDCNDDNPCTKDYCEPDKGCVHENLDGSPCDDGIECTINDTCVNGKCVGDNSNCTNCPPEFSNPVQKVTYLEIGKDGKPGHGLDIDENPATCAPSSNCSSGIDNNLSFLSMFANSEFQKNLDNGQTIMIFELKSPDFTGKQFQINFIAGKLADNSCDFQTQSCNYYALKQSYDDECNPLVSFDNATIVNNKLKAGGKNYNFSLSLPVTEGITVTVSLYFAHLEADVTVKNGKIDTMNGIMGGAIRKDEVIEAITMLPDDLFPENFPKDKVLNLINLLFKNDIDTDSDGEKDAASIGIIFQTIQGNIVDLTE